MKRNTFAILILLFIKPGFLLPQEARSATLNGYLTVMQGVIFDSLSGPFMNENLLHNRLNFKWYINDRFTFAAETRNRLFTGDMVRLGDYYSDMIGKDQGLVDMSWNVVSEQSFLFNATIDRLWLDFQHGRFQVTAGRQRINWGQALVWNPNDVFNAFSFYDFDYVERPGSDALRMQYFPSSSSAVEWAVKLDDERDITAAGLYRFNQWGYDIQFLAGFVDGTDIMIGTGWTGSIGSFSFRGEGSWFEDHRNFAGGEGTVLVTSGLDKIFKDNSMAQVQVMFCNNPLELNDFNSFYSGSLSSKDLAFSRFSALAQFTWAVTPLLNLTASGIWFPDLRGYYAGPTMDWSVSENLDFSLIWQHFDAIMSDSKTRINLGFLRLKYSF